MRPVTDKHNVSRAKLAYIIDATAAPVCMIAPISSWAAAVAGVTADTDGLDLFMRSIPYNLYSLLTIAMIILIIAFDIDFGPMKKHEDNAVKGDLFTCGNRVTDDGSMRAISTKGTVVDLAVPVDIEETIAEFPHTFFYNMDDLEELAETNNRAKKEAVCQAGEILEEFEEDFMRWMIFQQAVPRMQEVKHWMEEEAEKKGFGKAIDKLFYRIRENASPEELEAFVENLREPEK